MSHSDQLTPLSSQITITDHKIVSEVIFAGGGDAGLKFNRHFTTKGQHPYECVTWEKRHCEIKDSQGATIFSQSDLEVPANWSEMATTVVASKYLRTAIDSPERESSIKQLIDRVVNTITFWGDTDHYFSSQTDCETFRAELTHILLNQYASFNSPVWFNLGVEPHPQCSACFILSVEDTMPALLELQTIEGILFKSGSGCGTNLSSIRSSKEKLSGGGTASGPLSFMRGFDSWAGSIKSGGKTRRAAKMQILDVTHPDILEFIRCKADEEKKAWALIDAGYSGGFNAPGGAYDSVSFQNANTSIRVDDEFMKAVVSDGTYFTKRVTDQKNCEEFNARKVLQLASECVHICGDPGIQFDTTINSWHTCPRSGRIRASNPCSEYMHLDNSACNLASINLLKFLAENGDFAVDDFLHVVDILITAQDILIDHSRYPTKKIERCAHDFRQVGLGFANLGALLMSQGLPYDSEEGRAWGALVSSLMTAQAYKTSARLASVLGPFHGFRQNRKPMLAVIEKHSQAAKEYDFNSLPETLYQRARILWDETLRSGESSGFRNSQATVLAPTGTISFMMDCDTTGIEPDLALVKYKKLSGGGMLKIVNRSVSRGLKALGYQDVTINDILHHIDTHDTIEGTSSLNPEHLSTFDCAFQPVKGKRFIHHSGHLRMMASIQPFISGAISKTVNLPQTISTEEIFDIYVEAWRLGLKAVALYRDGSKRTQPLNTSAERKPSESNIPHRKRLPEERHALTHKFSIGGLEGYLTVGLYEDETPGEIFLVVAKEGSTLSGVMDAFATSVSIALQYGVPLATLVKKFTYSRFEPAGFTSNKEIPVAQSIVDYIFRWLALKFLSAKERAELGVCVGAEKNEILVKEQRNGSHQELSELLFKNLDDAPPCIRCGSSLMVRQGGCYYCLNCGSQGGCG